MRQYLAACLYSKIPIIFHWAADTIYKQRTQFDFILPIIFKVKNTTITAKQGLLLQKKSVDNTNNLSNIAYSGNGLKNTIELILSRITQIQSISNRTTADGPSQQRHIDYDQGRISLYALSNEKEREEKQSSSSEEQNLINEEINRRSNSNGNVVVSQLCETY